MKQMDELTFKANQNNNSFCKMETECRDLKNNIILNKKRLNFLNSVVFYVTTLLSKSSNLTS